MGFSPPEEFKSTDSKSEYLCPTCIVGQSYDLLHLALDSHKSHAVNNTPAAGNGSASSTLNSHLSPITGDTRHNHLDDSHLSDDESRAGTVLVNRSAAVLANVGNSGLVPPVRTNPADLSSAGRGIAHAPHGDSEVIAQTNGNTPDAQQGNYGFIPIHPDCENKGKKLLYILNNILHLPSHATTLLLGDSLSHCINKRNVDSETDSFRVRSVGGLCVVAAVQALLRHKPRHNNIKRIIWSLGINDHFHRGKHCHDEKAQYFKALERESSRVFPNAIISFIIPFRGMKGLDNEILKDLEKVLKDNCPKTKRHNPPNLKGMVDQKGVHPNNEGKKVLTDFFARNFVPHKPRVFNKNSGRKNPGNTYAAAHRPQVRQDPQTREDAVPRDLHPHRDRGSEFLGIQQQSFPPPPVQLRPLENSGPDQVVLDIAETLAHLMRQRNSEPTRTYNPQRQWYWKNPV